ncbi:phage tail protein [Ligilactobacillus ruminis]|uniref:Phage minor structural protein, N-terminal domain protein n=3 Tax=Ligilactobacillus ruminis TaxID=1623 RepID=E7FQJ6_9LACO|nr:phage tail spike protein [Ligilactobacillus ruminis]EFZ34666.1 phage minor structural protein, N-terminal domain protein [Ligilactobacillus ruminis ATCC 25644]UWP40586.1 phage tail protein [Ligilactobacillus ruminis]
MILYQLNKKQDVIGIVSSDVISATLEEQINTAGSLKFVVAKKLSAGCQYVLIQRPGAATYMCFKILTETQEDNQVSYTAVESAYDELGAYSYIKDMRPQNRTAKEMLQQILSATRFSVGYVADTGTQSTNFYYTTVLASLQSVVNLFNLEVTFDVVFDPIDNQVKRRLVNLYTQMGSRTGRRYEYGNKLLSVTREQSSDELVTALVGRGSSVQVSEGTDGSPDGYSRKITFADVVWKKSAGNPLDKPAGQEYLEDPSATAVYGFSDGKPRIGFVEFDKINDKNLLIKATYDKLQELKRPKVSFKASVTDVGNLSLGDTVAIIRHDLKIEYSTRVYKVTHDLLNAQNNTIELGDNFQKASITSTISAVQDTVQSAKDYSQSALQSANGKNTNHFGTSQPQFAVEGDLWYKDLGNGETEMYQYQNGNWELITSTAELHNTQKEVNQAIKNFNAQFKEIDDKYVPNETYQTEKQAFSTAVTKASETAQVAKATADTASANATEANNSASEARAKVDDVTKTVTENGKAIGEIKSDVSGVKATYATLDGKVTSASARAGALEAALSDGKGGLISVKAENNRIESLIDSKVDGSEYNTFKQQTSTTLSQKANKTDLNGYVTGTQFKQTADKVDTLASDVKSVKTKADTIETTMNSTSFANSVVKASGIDTKVAGYDTTIRKLIGKDGTTGDLNTLVSAYSNETSQTKKQTTNLISALDYNTSTGSFGSGFAKKVADAYGTTEAYKALNGKIDGLQIGGANLLDNSSMESTAIGHNSYDAMSFQNGWTVFTQKTTKQNRNNWYIDMPKGQPEAGIYTVSIDVKLLNCSSRLPTAELLIRRKSDWFSYGTSGECTLKVGQAVRLSAIATSPVQPTNDSAATVLQLCTTSSFVGQIAIRHVKLEKGTKATDWCMSDGDINKRIQTQADALTAYQAEVKRTYALSSSVYTKTETQTRENALKNATINDLKATDDWKKLIKINQNSSWIQDATGFQQQAWKYNLDSSGQLIGKKSFEDGTVGEWMCNDYKTKAVISGITSYSAYGYHKCIYTPNNNDLYWNVDCKVNPGDKYYVELLVPNFYSAHAGRTITVTAYFRYVKDGKSAWQSGPSGQVTTGTSAWIKGVITVPDNVTSVKPCIGVKDNGATSVVHLTYASFTKLDDYTQSNMTSIKQSSDGIGLKVAQLVGGSDISKIDMTSAAVKIDSKHILLDGDVAIDGTTFAKKIKATGITADMMLAGTIDAAKINVINIDASKITTGVLTAKIAKLMGSNNSWMSLDGSGIHAEGGTAANKDQWAFDLGSRGYHIKRQEPKSGDYRWTGGLVYGQNVANTNLNGLGLVVCPSSSGGNGDEISIGKVVKGNFDGGYEWSPSMKWSATGYGGFGSGFHWYDTCTLENDKARTIYTGGKDPFYIRNIRWGNSGYYYPSIQVGYNENTKSSSGIAFRWDDIKPWGTMNMENAEISCGASNKLRFTWCQWSNWYQQWKIPAISNRVSPTSGIAFASGGIREFAGSKVRDL